MNSILKDNKGTALLVSLLVMGVLVSVAIALSGLVFRELTITKDFLNSGKAYYVAESGVELALFGLDKNLPGWEPSDEGLQKYYVGSLEGEYKLDNRCKTYPCFDGYNLTDGGEGFKEYYDVLDHNDSIQIPLFIVDDGSEKPVANFVVEFYATFDPSTHLNFDNVNDLSGWDILRWKIYGLNELFGITESISDFTAFSLLNTGDEEIRVNTNSTNPSWFGTKRCTDMVDRIQDDIYCAQVKFTPGDAVSIGDDVIAETYLGLCKNTEARDYYEYEGVGDERVFSSRINCKDIGEFIKNHKFNYLTLTNLINSAVFNDAVDDTQKEAFSKIYFRIEVDGVGEEYSDELVRSVAAIKATGTSEDIKQSINVLKRRGSFMPVFNFSLYSTYKENCEDWGEECGLDDE